MKSEAIKSPLPAPNSPIAIHVEHKNPPVEVKRDWFLVQLIVMFSGFGVFGLAIYLIIKWN